MDIPQVSFAKGAVSPIAAARTDVAFYQSAVLDLRNFFVREEGGISNRPGLGFIGACSSDTPNGSYLLPFVYSNQQTYVVEMGAGATRLYSNGAFVQNQSAPVTITGGGLSPFNAFVQLLSFSATNTFTAGQTVTVSGVVSTGTVQPNGSFQVWSATGTTFTVLVNTGLTFTYTSGGSATGPLAIANPYALADLPNLRWAQSADTLSLVVATQPVYQLKRLTVNAFTLTAPQLLFGPFQDLNTDGTTYVYASGTTGTVDIFASGPIFTAAHVGALFTIQEQFLGSIAQWEAQKILIESATHSPVGMYIRSDGKTYQCVAAAASPDQTATGTFQPVHISGTQMDGDGQTVPTFAHVCGVSWQFVSTNAGVALITQFVSSTHVKAVVQSNKGIVAKFPPTVVGPMTTAFGPFTFSGDGSTVTFSPLTAITTGDPNRFLVTVGGVFQDPSTYTINLAGTSITFYTAPPVGVNNVAVQQVTGALTTIYADADTTLSPLRGLTVSTYWAFGSLSAVQGYPSDICYYNDRLILSGTILQPQSLFASQTGDYLNYGTSDPQVASDEITVTLNSRQQNPVYNLLPLNNLLLGTASASWRLTDTSGIGAITPSNVNALPQEFFGMADVPAVQTGTTVLYVQWGGRKIRDLLFNFYTDKYQGQELTVYARQMFPVGTTGTRAAFAPEPYGLAFFVRSDGVMCVCTYLPEQQVIAWSRYVTQGRFEDVCVVPENNSFSVYVIVGRTINGTYKRFIERFAAREYATLEDAFFVDSGLTYDGRNTTAVTMTLTGGSTWLAQDTGTLTASSSAGWVGFVATDPTLLNEIWLFQTFTFLNSVDGTDAGTLTVAVAPGTYPLLFSDGSQRSVTVALDGVSCSWQGALPTDESTLILSATCRTRLLITAYTSAAQVAVKFRDPVPAGLQGGATVVWTFARTHFSGLTQLAGATVSVFADGGVMPQQVVDSSGSFALPAAGGVIHAGLPYAARVQSLALNLQGQPSIRNRTKTMHRLSAIVDESAPFAAGPDFARLFPAEVRQFEDYGYPTQLITGVVHVPLDTDIDDEAYVCVEQADPVPLTLLGWLVDVTLGAPG